MTNAFSFHFHSEVGDGMLLWGLAVPVSAVIEYLEMLGTLRISKTYQWRPCQDKMCWYHSLSLGLMNLVETLCEDSLSRKECDFLICVMCFMYLIFDLNTFFLLEVELIYNVVIGSLFLFWNVLLLFWIHIFPLFWPDSHPSSHPSSSSQSIELSSLCYAASSH